MDPGFVLGSPELVCRWRLANRTLPLENRHLRALGNRMLSSGSVSTELVAWAKQHIEWTLADGSAAHPNGVLMIVVDEAGRAAMSVGPYEGLADTRMPALLARVDLAEREADETGVAPESLWVDTDEGLLWGLNESCCPSGASSLIEDLARTVGIRVTRQPNLLEEVRCGLVTYREAFIVSDEFGVVVPAGGVGNMGRRFAEGYARLLSKARA
ncbi:MAG: hypothetical protein J6D54_07295 [Olsenella sp.]|nr:hypothetical protein [Olsenella sp.]